MRTGGGRDQIVDAMNCVSAKSGKIPWCLLHDVVPLVSYTRRAQVPFEGGERRETFRFDSKSKSCCSEHLSNRHDAADRKIIAGTAVPRQNIVGSRSQIDRREARPPDLEQL